MIIIRENIGTILPTVGLFPCCYMKSLTDKCFKAQIHTLICKDTSYTEQ